VSAEPAFPAPLEMSPEAAVAVGLIIAVAIHQLTKAGVWSWPIDPEDRDGLKAQKKWAAKQRQKEAHKKFRAKPEVQRKRAEVARRWREQNHAKRLAQPWLQRRALVRNAVYHRPFISIDSEGMNLSGNDVP
jgi:hypothetical protein